MTELPNEDKYQADCWR